MSHVHIPAHGLLVQDKKENLVTPTEEIRLEVLKLVLEKSSNPNHNLDKADVYEKYIREGAKPKPAAVVTDRFRVFSAGGDAPIEVGAMLVMDDGETILRLQEPFSTDLRRQILHGVAQGFSLGLHYTPAVPAN